MSQTLIWNKEASGVVDLCIDKTMLELNKSDESYNFSYAVGIDNIRKISKSLLMQLKIKESLLFLKWGEMATRRRCKFIFFSYMYSCSQ